MELYYADLHVHIGRALGRQPVKITAADSLTITNALDECACRKGIQMLGVVDMASPAVIQETEDLIKTGGLRLLPGGGYLYRDLVTLIPGVEVETGEGTGTAHWIFYFGELEQIKEFSRYLSCHVTNINLSTQRCRRRVRDIWRYVQELKGVLVPAHVFTPFKSVFGNCASRIETLFDGDTDGIWAVELGLSADADMADCLPELECKTFLSNSDAHSLPKIGREYNVLELKQPDFAELQKTIRRQGGRRVAANYGLDPKLGKYHRTRCLKCDGVASGKPPLFICQECGSEKVVRGVVDRIAEIREREQPVHPEHRPPYVYQIPLSFLPGVGTITINRLIDAVGSEMAVMHQATREQLVEAAGVKVADVIIKAREGRLGITCGGGGVYGKVFQS